MMQEKEHEKIKEFKPFIPADKNVAELSWTAIVLGCVLGIVFGAANAYLGMKVGMTVSASIPAAVMSMAILRGVLKRGTILENNMVQTIASSGESLAAGVIFTIPSFLILRYLLRWDGVSEAQLPTLPSVTLTFLMTLIGGVIGIVMMIPLRRYLIVKEHGVLPYPEGTACAQVLEAGETGGSRARHVFSGMGLGSLYMFLMKGLHLWKDEAMWLVPRFYKGAMALDPTAALLSVGFIIGPRISACLFAGSMLGWVVLIPLLGLLGSYAPDLMIPPGVKPLADMSSGQIASNYIRYIGAGGVAAGGIISLIKALPVIVDSFSHSLRGLKSRLRGGSDSSSDLRTDRDLPMTFVFGMSLISALAIGLVLYVVTSALGIEEAPTLSFAGGFVAVLFAFFFITVAARIVGIVGSSSSPVSGMTITTLLAICFVLVGLGLAGEKTSVAAMVTALTAGAMVCVAVCSSGDISQDLKTGYLVGATPSKQQLAEFIGVLVPTIAVVGTVYLLLLRGGGLNTLPQYEGKVDFYNDPIVSVDRDKHLLHIQTKEYGIVAAALDEVHLKNGAIIEGKIFGKGAEVAGSEPHAWVLIKTMAGAVERFTESDYTSVVTHEDPMGELRAPQANIMAILVKGIIQGKLPWILVFLGVMISIVVELLGIGSLPFAIGLYLGIALNAPIMIGGMVFWMIAKMLKGPAFAAAENRGILLASGIIAGDALMGILLALLTAGGLISGLALREIGEAHIEDWITLAVFLGLTAIFTKMVLKKDS